MRLLYNLVFLAGLVLSAPYYFWRLWRRGNWTAGFGQRFGQYDRNLRQALTNRHVVWVHAVSVGEANVCVELIKALQTSAPNAKIVVSTTTTTGMAELQKKLPATVSKIYYPIDRRKYVDWAFRAVHPTAVILVETEIWPNFIWRAKENGTHLFLVNGRISQRSYPRYKHLGMLFRELFGSFTGVAAQTEEYAKQYIQLGCQPGAVRAAGNIKFDAALAGQQKEVDVPGLLEKIGIGADRQVLVCGSTHQGEEEVLSQIYLRLRQRFPSLFLVLVPRHFERAREATKGISRKLKVFLRSEIEENTQMAPGAVDCLVVNTTGELTSFYKHATLAFVGKSLKVHGGQNPIEPAAFGLPTLFGPNMQNFQDVARILTTGGGAIQVRDAKELESALAGLLEYPEKRAQLGRRAREIVLENQGAVARTLDMILPHLARRGFYLVSNPESARSEGGQPVVPAPVPQAH